MPTYSLVHRLIKQSNPSPRLGSCAHRFMHDIGLLRSYSPASATVHEVVFCEMLRSLNYREAAREVLAWLPRTPGVSYVFARLWLDEGRYDDAGSSLESIAGSFGA